MERRRLLGTLAGIGAAAILGGMAFAAASQSGGTNPAPQAPGPELGPAMMVPGLVPHALLGRVGNQLGLSSEQRQAIKGFFEQARPGLEQLHTQLRVNAELLAKTRPDDPAYQSVVANISQSAAELATQFVLQTSQLRSQVHGVLTPDQKDRLVALESERHTRLQQQRARGPHGEPAADGGPSGPQ
jgi:Spy/CpxP family protein refolding chaperone